MLPNKKQFFETLLQNFGLFTKLILSTYDELTVHVSSLITAAILTVVTDIYANKP